jgi:hypothetical protein
MLTDQGLNLLLHRLEKGAVDRSQLQDDYGALVEKVRRLETENVRIKSDNEALERSRDTARRENAQLRNEVSGLFPLLIDDRHQVWLAFKPTNGLDEVGEVKDDSGVYADAGKQPDFPALIGAPLNPRCFLTCRIGWMCLIRLPAPPTGELRILDSIPF